VLPVGATSYRAGFAPDRINTPFHGAQYFDQTGILFRPTFESADLTLFRPSSTATAFSNYSSADFFFHTAARRASS
jgi:hypothetical protein